MANPPHFKLLPCIAIRDDLETIVTIGYRAFADDPMATILYPPPSTEAEVAEFLKTGVNRSLERLEKFGNRARYVKIVLDEPDKAEEEMTIVAYAAWRAPKLTGVDPEPKSASKTEDKSPEQEDATILLPSTTIAASMEDFIERKSLDLFGKDWESKVWYLASLATLPAYQRMGLGARLVRWGIEQAEEDAKARPGMVDGVATIATPAGLRTYENEGMVFVGENVRDVGKGLGEGGYKMIWLMKRFGETNGGV